MGWTNLKLEPGLKKIKNNHKRRFYLNMKLEIVSGCIYGVIECRPD